MRELRATAAAGAERRLPDVRERAAVRTLRANRRAGRHADALRPGMHRLHALLQDGRAVRALRDTVQMALATKGAGARPAPVSAVRASRPRDLRGLPAASSAGAGGRRAQAVPSLHGAGRDPVSGVPAADAGRMRQALLGLLLEKSGRGSDPAERGRDRLAGAGAAVRGLRRMARRENRTAQDGPEHQAVPGVFPADREGVERHPRVRRAAPTLRGDRPAPAPAGSALDGGGRTGCRRCRRTRGRLRTPTHRSDSEQAARRVAGSGHPRRVPRNAARTRESGEVRSARCAWPCRRPPGCSR